MRTRFKALCLSASVMSILTPGTAGEIRLAVDRFVPAVRIPPGGQNAVSGLAISPDGKVLYAAQGPRNNYLIKSFGSSAHAVFPAPWG
jgi:hypothetical protein